MPRAHELTAFVSGELPMAELNRAELSCALTLCSLAVMLSGSLRACQREM